MNVKIILEVESGREFAYYTIEKGDITEESLRADCREFAEANEESYPLWIDLEEFLSSKGYTLTYEKLKQLEGAITIVID
jgi:hypothetical protein